MITKIGSRIVKQSSLTAAAAAAAASHVAQNAGLRWALNNIEKSRLLNVIVRAIGKPGQGMSTIPGNLAYGATTGLIPEIGMIEKKLSENVGRKLSDALDSQGLNINHLPRRHATALSLAAQGRFRDAYRIASTPESRKMLDSVMEQFYPEMGTLSGNFPALKNKGGPIGRQIKETQRRIGLSQEKFEELLENLEKGYAAHPLTGQIAESFKGGGARKIRDMLKGDDNALKRLARNGANLATRAALIPAEAGMAVLNEGKRFADWELLQKTVPTKKLQDWASEKLVLNPMRESFEAGLGGKPLTRFRGMKEALDDVNQVRQTAGAEAAKNLIWEYTKDGLDAYGVNAFTNMGKHMANGFGLALNRVGIKSKEDLDRLRENAVKMRELWQKTSRGPDKIENANSQVTGPLTKAISPQAIIGKTVSPRPELGFRDVANGATLLSLKC